MIEQTRQKLKKLRLPGMLDAYDALAATNAHKGMTIDEMLAHLVDAETEERYDRKVARLIKGAHFRYRAVFDQMDLSPERGFDRTLMVRIAEMKWADRAETIIITGKTGSGKSYLACAIGHKACTMERRVMYFPVMKLFRTLKESFADNSYSRVIRSIAKTDILIIDDFGLEPFTPENRRWLLEILEDRYDRCSTVISSQLPERLWAEVIGDPTFADAIIDRIKHGAHRIKLVGEESMRNRKARSV